MYCDGGYRDWLCPSTVTVVLKFLDSSSVMVEREWLHPSNVTVEWEFVD